MERNEIQTIVIKTLATALKCDINADSSRDNTPSWDSLKHIEVVFALEDALGVEFSEDDQSELVSVSSIVDRAQARHAA